MAERLKQPSASDVDKAIAALNSVRREWMRRPGVTATDVGYKRVGDQLTDTLAIRAHVERKIPVAQLHASEVFNVSDGTPETLGGFPVDVIEATYGPSQVIVADPQDVAAIDAVDRKTRVSPLIGGVSCGNPRVTAGTIGAIVFDLDDGSPHILSNWHVLAGDRSAQAGEAIWQPGVYDGGTAVDAVASLHRFRLDADMDAAIASLNGQRPHVRDLLGLGPVTGMTAPAIGMLIRKSGRTTALTAGIVDGVSTSVTIDYGGTAGLVTLNDQFHIVPRPPWPAVDYEVSQGGDSGSVWVNETNMKAVGLHFAGEGSAPIADENAIATPIERVATALRFSFHPVLAPFATDLWRFHWDRFIVRNWLCQRFPFLCQPFPIPVPTPPFPPGPGPDPGPFGPFSNGTPVPHAAGTCAQCGGATTSGPVDELLDALEAMLSGHPSA